ncbi:MAG: DUF4147 domain-containing protein [Candidatus Brocadiia bacterium]
MVSLSNIKFDVKAVFAAALRSANPYNATLKHLARNGPILQIEKYQYNLDRIRSVYVFGAGKAALLMALATEKILGRYLTGGIVCIPDNYPKKPAPDKIKVRSSAHPIPDKQSLQWAIDIKEMLGNPASNDLVIYLASGGGSSLLTIPAAGSTLKDVQQLTGLLLKSGADIREMNTVRKHIDMFKGGWLALYAHPASLITLVLSDVVGDEMNMVSSGPTLPDSSTFKDVYNILVKYDIWTKTPYSISERILFGMKDAALETPKPKDKYFFNARPILVGSNSLALSSARTKAKSLGYETIILPQAVTGEARIAASVNAEQTIKLAKSRTKPLFIISGGETAVTVKGNGTGGRNQEYALAFALRMKKLNFHNFICLSCSTDGIDNVKETAGAMVDDSSVDKAVAKGLNPFKLLKGNDSYHFHKAIGSLVKTGPTGTNVNDIQITAVW